MLTHAAPVVPKYSQWSKAFIQSLETVLLCVIAVGFLFLPQELRRLRAKPKGYATSCIPLPDGKLLISIALRSIKEQRTEHGTTRILLRDLFQSPHTTRFLLPNMSPRCLAVDSLGDRLFLGDTDGALYSTSLRRSDNATLLLGHVVKSHPSSMLCTLDGTSLMVQDHFGLYAWNVDIRSLEHGSPRWCVIASSISCFEIYPDSLTAICVHNREGNSDLWEINIQTGDSQPILKKIGRQVEKLVISPCGGFLASLEENGEIALFCRGSNAESWQPYSIPGLIASPTMIASFSPQSDVLITSHDDSRRFTLLAWDLKRKAVNREFDAKCTVIGCVFVNDKQFVSLGTDNTLRVWNQQNASPEREIKL
ncbi:MAG: WD40 repeat domain-containing protein [Pirellula sp.]